MAKKSAASSNNAERSAFLREFKKRKAELVEAAKKEASSGFLTDEEIIESLGLDETRQQFLTKVSRVRYGLDKHKSPYYAFNYTIIEGEHEGVSVSQFFGLGGNTKAERQKKDERLCANFQRLNVNTTKWKPAEVIDKLVEAADEMTLKKPTARIALYTWGDDPDNPRLGVDILGITTAKPEDTDSEEDQYEDAEASEEVEEDDTPAEDYAEWVGFEATFDPGDGEITVTTTAWDEDTGLLTCEDENGDTYEADPEALDFGEE
jgi:hypothetical protein